MSPLAVGTSTSPEKYQSKTSATPSFASATYPSRDIDMIATTLAMVQLLSRKGRRVIGVAADALMALYPRKQA